MALGKAWAVIAPPGTSPGGLCVAIPGPSLTEALTKGPGSTARYAKRQVGDTAKISRAAVELGRGLVDRGQRILSMEEGHRKGR